MIFSSRTRLLFFGLTATLVLTKTMFAQSTSSVFNPDVSKGESAFEYRAAYDADSDTFGQRIHYQYGFTDSFRGRIILTQRSTDAEPFDFRYIRFEGQWQFLRDQDVGFDSALRFELQIADGDNRPSRARIAWSTKYVFDNALEIRGVLLTGHQFGADSGDGFLLDARTQINYPISETAKIGIDYYANFNNHKNIGSFDEQKHSIGPIYKQKLRNGWSFQLGPLFGLSDAASDFDFRLFVIKKL